MPVDGIEVTLFDSSSGCSASSPLDPVTHADVCMSRRQLHMVGLDQACHHRKIEPQARSECKAIISSRAGFFGQRYWLCL